MEIAVNVIGNSTVTVTVDKTIKFGVDPALGKEGSSLGFGIYRKKNPIYDATTFQNLDFWLLTHAHEDHLDRAGSGVIEAHTPIISALSCKKAVAKLNIQNDVEYIDWNQTTTFEKEGYVLTIRAIPAYHGHGPLVVKLMTRVNGYIVTVAKDEERSTLYFTSDTVYNQKVVSALQGVEVDILIANLGEAKAPLPVTTKPITMGVSELQKFQKLTKAEHVVPLHIDDYSHFQTKREAVLRVYPILEDGETKIFKLERKSI